MQTRSKVSRSKVMFLRLLTCLLIAAALYAANVFQQTSNYYDGILEDLTSAPVIADKAKVGETTLTVPTYDLFESGGLWALVSKKRPLSGEASYKLIDIPVMHGDSDRPMKVAEDLSDELQQLVNAAEADDEPLMVSSAYRSLGEQRAIYDEFVAENGETLARQYVSPPGASEHQTGLSVDFSSLSDECEADSDACSLSQSGAAWLAKNANRFGFIQRYPEGKSSITGVAYEPWHFRFVGKPLARAMDGSGLTLDEVIEQLAPGYALSRQ